MVILKKWEGRMKTKIRIKRKEIWKKKKNKIKKKKNFFMIYSLKKREIKKKFIIYFRFGNWF
jgi:hypothetical protein